MTAPRRSRPGADSPFKLAVEVEPVRTPIAIEPDESAAPSQVIGNSPSPAKSRNERPPTQQSVPKPPSEPVADELDHKTAVTVQIRSSLRLRAQTAVLRTAGLPGGHKSFAALVDTALLRELQRLESAFNDGEPFARNEGAFRTGRPFAD